MNLKNDAYNLERVILGYNGDKNFVIALKIDREHEYFSRV